MGGVAEPERHRAPYVSAVLRGDVERVTPLELFFDLVFVLAITQCSALMVHEPTWSGLAKGLLVLGMLWWSWVGYAWLTSVVDPEEGTVRLALFAAMAAMLVVSLSVPQAFGDHALLFACAYGVFRYGQIWLFVLASRDDDHLRRSVGLLAISTGVGVALLVVAAFTDGLLQGGLWALALLLDMGGPYVYDSSGWKLVPGHFAERHGLIVLIALGESIVAIGAGAEVGIDAGVVMAVVLGLVVSAALFWLYFDVVALVAARRLSNAAPGRERNEIARDSFSYLHFPMVAGIVLVAVGIRGDAGRRRRAPAPRAGGGVARRRGAVPVAHVAFRWRNVHRFGYQRLIAAGVCVALVPVAEQIPALATLALLAAVLVTLIADERRRFAELRERLRRQLAEA